MALLINVAVFFGGKSVEHEVSVISAVQAIHSMDEKRYRAIPVYISKKGVMYSGEALTDIEQYKNIPALLNKCAEVTFKNTGKAVVMKMTGADEPVEIHVAMPIVHGLNVEDGTIEGFLHLLGLPYTGCNVLSSALCMNKYYSKLVLKAHGIPVLDCERVSDRDFYSNPKLTLERCMRKLGAYPVIVKPASLGSSVGIAVAGNASEFEAALSAAFMFASDVIVEPAITSLREVNCAVLGNSAEMIASECEEPLNDGKILSYADKYMSGGDSKQQAENAGGVKGGMASLKRRIPAELDAKTRAYIQALSKKTFLVLGCEGIVRIDYIIDGRDGKVYLNEVNTIPGSLAFYLFEPIGISYRELLSALISTAFTRKRSLEAISGSFDTNLLALSGGKKLGGKL